jgi:hypothetical protein
MAEATRRTAIVVGEPLAGVSGGRALRREGFAGGLVAIGEEDHLPCGRPLRLSALPLGPDSNVREGLLGSWNARHGATA